MDEDRRPKELVLKGRGFSEADKTALRSLVLKTIGDVVPEYRRRQDEGTIEISTTPFYHPILPLLVNSQVDDGNVPVVFRFPEDAEEQLRRSREFMLQRFGRYPQGLWPSEGSVSNDVAAIVSRLGFRWMATDEGILEKSGIHIGNGQRHRLVSAVCPRWCHRILSRSKSFRPDRLSLHAWIATRWRRGSGASNPGNPRWRTRHHRARWRKSMGLLREQRPGFSALSL